MLYKNDTVLNPDGAPMILHIAGIIDLVMHLLHHSKGRLINVGPRDNDMSLNPNVDESIVIIQQFQRYGSQNRTQTQNDLIIICLKSHIHNTSND